MRPRQFSVGWFHLGQFSAPLDLFSGECILPVRMRQRTPLNAAKWKWKYYIYIYIYIHTHISIIYIYTHIYIYIHMPKNIYIYKDR